MLLFASLLLLMLAAGLFALTIPLRIILYLCEGRFIRAGFWLCLGIALINLFFGEGESFRPLYIAIMTLALVTAIGRWLLSRPGAALSRTRIS
jgi:hypothetical protein